jgi:plasmid maintenance system antidote protein VapI
MAAMRRVPEVDEVVQRIVKKMKPWGLTLSYLAQNLGVSRQYVWQIIHYRTVLSRAKALEIEKAVDRMFAHSETGCGRPEYPQGTRSRKSVQ